MPVPEWTMTIEESIRRRSADGSAVDINSIRIDTGLPYDVIDSSLRGMHGQVGRYRASDQKYGQQKIDIY